MAVILTVVMQAGHDEVDIRAFRNENALAAGNITVQGCGDGKTRIFLRFLQDLKCLWNDMRDV